MSEVISLRLGWIFWLDWRCCLELEYKTVSAFYCCVPILYLNELFYLIEPAAGSENLDQRGELRSEP